MKPQTTFVRTESGIKLDAVASVDLGNMIVIFPDDSELDYTLRNLYNVKSFLVFRVLLQERS